MEDLEQEGSGLVGSVRQCIGRLGRPGLRGSMGTAGQGSMRSRFGMGAGLFSNLGD